MILRNKNLITKFVFGLLLTAFSAERLHAENIDLIVLAGQSNMQGVQGDAAQYPADPGQHDQKIIFTSMLGLEKADRTHLTPNGLEEHGERLFAAYQTLTTKVQPAAATENNTAP